MQRLFEHTVLPAQLNDLVSGGSRLVAWASHKSYRPKDCSGDSDSGDFHGKMRGTGTHASTTDPDACLMRKGKGKEVKLSYEASTLMENRHGLLVALDVCHATGTSVRDVRARDRQVHNVWRRQGRDARDFVQALTERGIKTHIARNHSDRPSAVDGRTARGKG